MNEVNKRDLRPPFCGPFPYRNQIGRIPIYRQIKTPCKRIASYTRAFYSSIRHILDELKAKAQPFFFYL